MKKLLLPLLLALLLSAVTVAFGDEYASTGYTYDPEGAWEAGTPDKVWYKTVGYFDEEYT